MTQLCHLYLVAIQPVYLIDGVMLPVVLDVSVQLGCDAEHKLLVAILSSAQTVKPAVQHLRKPVADADPV